MCDGGSVTVKPVSVNSINEGVFLRNLNQSNGTFESEDVNEFTDSVTHVLYQCVSVSRAEVRVQDVD